MILVNKFRNMASLYVSAPELTTDLKMELAAYTVLISQCAVISQCAYV